MGAIEPASIEYCLSFLLLHFLHLSIYGSALSTWELETKAPSIYNVKAIYLTLRYSGRHWGQSGRFSTVSALVFALSSYWIGTFMRSHTFVTVLDRIDQIINASTHTCLASDCSPGQYCCATKDQSCFSLAHRHVQNM